MPACRRLGPSCEHRPEHQHPRQGHFVPQQRACQPLQRVCTVGTLFGEKGADVGCWVGLRGARAASIAKRFTSSQAYTLHLFAKCGRRSQRPPASWSCHTPAYDLSCSYHTQVSSPLNTTGISLVHAQPRHSDRWPSHQGQRVCQLACKNQLPHVAGPWCLHCRNPVRAKHGEHRLISRGPLRSHTELCLCMSVSMWGAGAIGVQPGWQQWRPAL